MKKGHKWMLLGTAMVLLGAGIFAWPQETPAPRSLPWALQPEPGDRRALLCRTWRWRQTVDAYRGGTTLTPSDSALETLTFWTDGTYHHQKTGYTRTGQWALDEAARTLALTDQLQADLDQEDYRHKIRKLNADTLVLAWQGRHGMVTELYQAHPTPPSLREAAIQ